MLLLTFLFVLVYGACVGSFLNVVVYRVPAGVSLLHPPSSCPACGSRIAWYDNVPVLAWLWLKGRCRACGTRISMRYPIVEAATAALWGLVFAAFYFWGWRPEIEAAGLGATWPLLVAHLVLVSGLLAATLIDAEHYIIPVEVTFVVALVPLVLYPLSVAMGWLPADLAMGHWVERIVPGATLQAAGAAFGGAAGLMAAIGLLAAGLLPRSFDELAAEVTDDMPAGAAPPTDTEAHANNDEPRFAPHPHPRREALKEIAFLLLPILGGLIGWWLAPRVMDAADLAAWAAVLGGVVGGYLIGGGVVWAIRILGTLAFGKEAMGLGDAYLMACVGAVIGAADATLAFFIAPFLGLLGTLAIRGLGGIIRGLGREIPYGPYLAAATLMVVLGRGVWWMLLGMG